MKLKLVETVYALYIKGTRFIGHFKTAEDAMEYGTGLYPTEEKHVEPIFLMEIDKS